MAGANAAAKCQNKDPLKIGRTDGYMGVLVDDLTTLGTTEPYRMFTSRAEFRLSLRPDNADLRLTEKGYRLGLVSEERYRKMTKMRSDLERAIEIMRQIKMTTGQWRDVFKLPTAKTSVYKR